MWLNYERKVNIYNVYAYKRDMLHIVPVFHQRGPNINMMTCVDLGLHRKMFTTGYWMGVTTFFLILIVNFSDETVPGGKLRRKHGYNETKPSIID